MSLNLTTNKARLTVFGYGWDDEVVDSGDADTDEGAALEEYVENNTDYEFPDDFDWDAVAEDMGVELDDDGNITDTDTLDDNLYDLANDYEAICDYMTEKTESTIPPARIVILNPPDLTTYSEGDTIDYSGIIVAAFTSLTTMTPYINSSLEGEMNNLIPFDQLIFPTTTAEADGGTYDDGDVVIEMITMSAFSSSVLPNPIYHYYDGNPYSPALTDSGGGYDVFPETSVGSSYYVTRYEDKYYLKPAESSDEWTTSGGTYWVEPDGYTAVVTSLSLNNGWKHSLFGSASNNSFVSTSSSFFGLGNDDIEAGIVKRQTLTVQWQTEYQTDPFEDTFDITVN